MTIDVEGHPMPLVLAQDSDVRDRSCTASSSVPNGFTRQIPRELSRGCKPDTATGHVRPNFGSQTGATTFSTGVPPSSLTSGTAVVTAAGDIDFHTAPALSRRLHQAIENYAAVVLDLTAVTLFSRAGLPILVCAADHADSLAVAFAVVCHEPSAVCFGLRTPVIIASSGPVLTDACGHHEKKKPS
ncbi:MAG TPA: STAS domain-containing protein [Pseudonocardia sp.]